MGNETLKRCVCIGRQSHGYKLREHSQWKGKDWNYRVKWQRGKGIGGDWKRKEPGQLEKRQEHAKPGQESSMGHILGSSLRASRPRWAPSCLASSRGPGKNWGAPPRRKPLISSGCSPVLRTWGQDGPMGKGTIHLQRAQPQTSPPVSTSCPPLLLFASLCSVLLVFLFPQLCFLFPLETVPYRRDF